jgi:thiol-disulfide isomerase/thioredoxin
MHVSCVEGLRQPESVGCSCTVEPWWKKRPQPNFVDADSLQQLVSILEHNADKLVLVEFFAPWCNSCKALYPKVSQLCEQNPQIIVAKINFEQNRELAKKLGIKVRI